MTPLARALCVLLAAIVLAGCAADPKRTGGVRIVTKSERAGVLPRHAAVTPPELPLPGKADIPSTGKVELAPIERSPAAVAPTTGQPLVDLATAASVPAVPPTDDVVAPARAGQNEPPSEGSEPAKIESVEPAPLPREMPALLLTERRRLSAADAGVMPRPSKPVAVKNPWIGQKTPTDCGRAALATVATPHGVNAEAAYARVMKPKDAARGYSLSEMLEQSARLGVSMRLMAPPGVRTMGECLGGEKLQAYFRQMSELVNAGSPLVVPIVTERTNHYLVLLSSTDGNFTIRDPAREENTLIGANELARLMCPLGYIVMVSTPPRGKLMPKLALSRESQARP